jgi:hypothetical protein
MLIKAANLIRLAVVAAVLGFAAAQTADAQRTAPSPRGAVSTSASRPGRTSEPDEPAAEPPGDPLAGVIWIVGAVAILVFFAWLAMRVGDPQKPADGIPN